MKSAKQSYKENECGEEVVEQFKLAKQYLDPVHERMNQQEELYRCYIDKTNYPHNAKVFDPRIFRVIETITPRMVANEPTGSFYPSEDGDIQGAHIHNALHKYDWRKAEMFPKMVMSAKSMLLFGTFFGRNFWDYRTSTKKRMVPKEINGRMIWTPKNTEEIEVTDYDGPNYELFNIYDCFPDPNATSLGNMRWFIYRMFKTLPELEKENDARGAEYWKNLDKVREAIDNKKEEKTNKATDPSDMQFREHRRVMLSTQEFIGKDESNPDLTILCQFKRDGWVYVLPEYGNLVIREVENPYFHGDLPLVYGVDYQYPGELYGMGEIEPLDRIQRAINAVLNQRLDNVQLTLHNMWKVKKNAGVDMHTLFSAPGNIITTGDMNAVEAVNIPDVTGPTFVQTMTYLTSAMQNGSGVTDYTIGIGNNQTVGNDTATGTRLIQQEANAQFKLKIQLFNHMVIQRIANQWKDLRVQYTTDKQMLRIMGKEAIEYLRDNTELTRTDVEGNPIMPGDMTTKAKLEIGRDGSFAFLQLMPEDIQPNIVGDYDFIAKPSSEQIDDPIAMQNNFFDAIKTISTPAWTQGLAAQKKMLNYQELTSNLFDKMNTGVDDSKIVMDIPAPEANPMGGGQPLPQEALDQMKMPQSNPLPPAPEQTPMSEMLKMGMSDPNMLMPQGGES